MIADKGKSVALLKPGSKQKRTRAEIEEVKSEEEFLKHDKQGFLQEFKRMKSNQGLDNQEMVNLFAAQQQLEKLRNAGYIDEEGKPSKRAREVRPRFTLTICF